MSDPCRTLTIKHTITRVLTLPDGATHISTASSLLDNEPRFYKCTQVGVVGDHWWFWNYHQSCWHFSGHSKPHFIVELPQEDVVETASDWDPQQYEED